MQKIITAAALVASLVIGHSSAEAQILAAPPEAAGSRVADLQRQLVNRLRATTPERQEFVRRVVVETEAGRIEPRLVQALVRYSVRRRPDFPFPFFERAMRIKAKEVGVDLPPVRLIRASSEPPTPLR